MFSGYREFWIYSSCVRSLCRHLLRFIYNSVSDSTLFKLPWEMDRKKHPKERCPVLYKQNSSERLPQWIQKYSENLFAISKVIMSGLWVQNFHQTSPCLNWLKLELCARKIQVRDVFETRVCYHFVYLGQVQVPKLKNCNLFFMH